MPFSTPTSSYLEDLARRRAIEEELGQKMAGAANTLTQGVSTLYGQQRQGEADAREAARLKLSQDTAAHEMKLGNDRLALEKSGQAAAQANAAAHLDIAKHADERAAAEAAARAQDAAKKEARTRVDAVVRPLMDDPNVGPKAALQEAMNRIAGAPGFETITPDDVTRAHHDYLIELAEKARATGRQDAADEAKDLAEKDRVRHEKEMESQGRTGLAIERERIAAGKENAAAKAEAGAGKLSPADDRRRSQVQEIESRAVTIRNNISDLKKQIDETGTYEVFGPQNDIMRSKLVDIATDMAKLKDPNSAAMKGEVDRELASIGLEPKVFAQASTMKAVLDDLLGRVKSRVDEAYKVRGIAKDAATGQVGAPSPPPGSQPSAPMNLDAMKPEDLANLSDDELQALLGRK